MIPVLVKRFVNSALIILLVDFVCPLLQMVVCGIDMIQHEMIC
jgi:hypothetical protein